MTLVLFVELRNFSMVLSKLLKFITLKWIIFFLTLGFLDVIILNVYIKKVVDNFSSSLFFMLMSLYSLIVTSNFLFVLYLTLRTNLEWHT